MCPLTCVVVPHLEHTLMRAGATLPKSIRTSSRQPSFTKRFPGCRGKHHTLRLPSSQPLPAPPSPSQPLPAPPSPSQPLPVPPSRHTLMSLCDSGPGSWQQWRAWRPSQADRNMLSTTGSGMGACFCEAAAIMSSRVPSCGRRSMGARTPLTPHYGSSPGSRGRPGTP